MALVAILALIACLMLYTRLAIEPALRATA
jgi:hypothetical protein